METKYNNKALDKRIKITSLDRLFSYYIRWIREEGKCKRCGRQFIQPTNILHCSHFYGRANRRVRYDPDNCDAMCYHDHQYLSSHPNTYVEWKKEQLGEKKFEDLNKRANWPHMKKIDLKLVELWLKQELKKHESSI